MVEWPTYSGDLAGTRYSPLDQISADNFGDLEIAWRLPTLKLRADPGVQVREHAAHGGRGRLHDGRHTARGRGGGRDDR